MTIAQHMRQWIVIVIGVITLVGCSAQPAATVTPLPTRGPFPTLQALPWRPYSGAITAQSVPGITFIGNMAGHNSTVNQLAFARFNPWLVSIDAMGAMNYWMLTTGERRFSLLGVRYASFNGDDGALMVFMIDGSVQVFTTQTTPPNSLKQVNMVEGKVDYTVAVTSPDRTVIAIGTTTGQIDLWDTATRTIRATLQAGKGQVVALAFAPDNRTLAAIVNDTPGTSTFSVGVWDDTTPITNLRQFGQFPPQKLDFSPDGNLLAVGLEGEVRLYNTQGYSIQSQIRGEDLNPGRDMRFSPDGKFIAATAYEESIYVWTSDGRLAAKLPGNGRGLSSITFTADGSLMLTTNRTPQVGARVWQTSAFKPDAAEYPNGTIAPDANGILTGAFSPDGQLLILAEASGSLVVYGLPKG